MEKAKYENQANCLHSFPGGFPRPPALGKKRSLNATIRLIANNYSNIMLGYDKAILHTNKT
jgi:hypothetical protein